MRETENNVYFWTGKDYLSNFYYSPFKHEGHLFKWSEQAVMWRKAKLFGAPNVAERILLAQTAKDCKALGRSHDIPFNHEIWEANREQVYYEVLCDKFRTPKLKSLLLGTGDKKIVEASPYDKIWGCGLAENDSRIENESLWPKGALNLLGKVLMRVRETLREEETNNA